MLYWKSHINQRLSKLSAASYVIRVLKAFVTQDTLVMGFTFIQFWIRASFSRVILHTVQVFSGYKTRQLKFLQALGKEIPVDLFKAPNILSLQSQYILSLLCFVVMNTDQYKVNSDIHGKDSRQSSILHQTTYKLLLYQWALRFSTVFLFN
jgi:hypothetical protein